MTSKDKVEKKTLKPTLMQKKFVAAYLKTGKKKKSAIKAGYSKKTAGEMAYENLRKPHIQEYIQTAAEKLGISPEYVLNNFKELVEFGKKKTIKAKQVGTEVYQEEELNDGQLAFKANEALGKHLSLFTEKLEIKAEIKDENITEDRQVLLAKKICALLSNPKVAK